MLVISTTGLDKYNLITFLMCQIPQSNLLGLILNLECNMNHEGRLNRQDSCYLGPIFIKGLTLLKKHDWYVDLTKIPKTIKPNIDCYIESWACIGKSCTLLVLKSCKIVVAILDFKSPRINHKYLKKDVPIHDWVIDEWKIGVTEQFRRVVSSSWGCMGYTRGTCEFHFSSLASVFLFQKGCSVCNMFSLMLMQP